ncbi:MAG: hypothetical protein ACR2J8_05380 [Thermomicrobiales bacterium]
MTDPFARLNEWHDFYAAVAGISATLIGLLFVGLALNPAIMADRSPAGLRTWAGQTFHSFLMVLTIGLLALIPGPGPHSFGLPLVIVAGLGLFRLLRDAARARHDPDPAWRGRLLMRFAVPLAGYATALWVGIAALRGDPSAVRWLVASIFLLMMNATENCWDLLKEIGDRHEG